MIWKILNGVLRHVLTTLGGGLVADGWLDGNELNTAVGAILALVGVGWSVWQKSKKRSEPGGEFNPAAELRKSLPADPQAPGLRPATGAAPGGGITSRKGFATPGALAALIAVIGFLCLGVAFLRASDPDGREFQTSGTCGGRAYADWIQYDGEIHRPGYHRPFLDRLAESLAPWGEVGADKAKVRVSQETAEVSGGWKDADQPRLQDFRPETLALGLTGGAGYWSFSEW